MVKAVGQGNSPINVISDGTDTFILLLHYFERCRISASVLIEGTRAQRRTTDIRKTVDRYRDIVPHFSVAHALSGRDSVVDIYGIVKTTVIKDFKL